MDVDKDLRIDKRTIRYWEHGIKTVYKWRDPEWYKEAATRYSGMEMLRPYFADMIDGKRKLKIADLGTGAFVQIGNYWPSAIVEIYPMDYIADEYMEYLKSIGIEPVYQIEKQDMENLTYEDNFFDIVHCSNALDHCLNPKKALTEMIRVCKSQGWIYLRHMPNNARKLHYGGLHQWNIDYMKGDCLFWTKDRATTFKLSEVGDFRSTVKKDIPEMRSAYCISVMQK